MERVPGGTSDSLLLVVDQFEELFRFSGRVIRDEVEAFVALLMGSVSQTKVPIYVVLTMRSDFLGDCARFEGLPELINRSQYLTPRMSREEYRHAIEDPARVFGGRVSPNVTSRLLNDMVNMSDQLCLIQHALLMMWRIAKRRRQPVTEITLEDYEAIDGLGEAISHHAEQVLDAVILPSANPATVEDGHPAESTKTAATPDKLIITERLFRRLTEGSGRESDIRRPTQFGELLELIGCSEPDLRAVIEEFRAPGNNFLTPLPHIPIQYDTEIDICHESLIRQWKRLREWTDRESESAAAYRRLEQTAILWRQGKAGLWPLPDVERAIIWRKEQQPTEAWAKQYGKNFDAAIAFLEESRKANQTALIVRRALLFASIIVPIVLAAVLYGWWASEGKKDQLARQGEVLATQKTVLETQTKELAALQTKTNQLFENARDWRSGALKAQFRAILASAETELGKGRTHQARALALAGGDLMRAEDPLKSFQQDSPDYRRYMNTLVSTLRVDGREIYVERGAIEAQQVMGAFSADSRIVAWASKDSVHFSDAATGIAITSYPTANELGTLSLAPDGRLAARVGESFELFGLDRGKLASASDVINSEAMGAATFAETAQGYAVVGITKAGEPRAWYIAQDEDRVEPIQLLGKEVPAPSSDSTKQAVSCEGSRCITFDGIRLRLFELSGTPREVANGRVATDPPSRDSPADEENDEPSSKEGAAQSVLLVKDTVILGVGTSWSSFKIDETTASIAARPAGDWLDNAYLLLTRGASGNVLGVDKVEGRTRFTASELGADGPTETVNGLFDAQRIVAVSPDGANVLAVESSEDGLYVLKVVQFTSTAHPCRDCSGLLSGRSGEVYLVAGDAIHKFNPASTKFDEKVSRVIEKARKELSSSQVKSGSVSGSASGDAGSSIARGDNPEIDLRLMGWESDPDVDRIYLVYRFGRWRMDSNIIVVSADVASDTVTVLKEEPNRDSAGSAAKPDLRQITGRKAFPRLVINPSDRVPYYNSIYISPAADVAGELRWTRGPRARARVAGQTAIVLNKPGELTILRANDVSASPRDSDLIRLSGQDAADFGFIDENTIFVAYPDGLIEFHNLSLREMRAVRLEIKIEIGRVLWSRTAQKLIVVGSRPPRRETTVVAWVEPASGLITNLYEHGSDVVAIENPDADTALVVGGGIYSTLSGMRTLDPDKVEGYAREITANWYSKRDIEGFGLLVLDSKMGQSAANAPGALLDCKSPALSQVLEAFGDETSARRNNPEAYAALCSELHRANLANGFKAWVADQLTQHYLFGEKTTGSDLLRFDLIRFGRNDHIASVNIADRLLAEGSRCDSSKIQALRQLLENTILEGGVVSPSYFTMMHDCHDGSGPDLKREVRIQMEKLSAARDPVAHAILGMWNERQRGSQVSALAHYEAASTILYDLRRMLDGSEFERVTQAWARMEQAIGSRRSALATLVGVERSLEAHDMSRQLLSADQVSEGPAASSLYADQTASARVTAMSAADVAVDTDKAEQKLRQFFGKTAQKVLISNLTAVRYLRATRHLDRAVADKDGKAQARPLLLGILRTAESAGATDPFAAAAAPLALQYVAHRPDSDDEAFEVLRATASDAVYRLSDLSQSPRKLGNEEWAKNLDRFAGNVSPSDLKSRTQIAILRLGIMEDDADDMKNWEALREQQHQVYELLKQAPSLDDYKSSIKSLSRAYVDIGRKLYESRSPKEATVKPYSDSDKVARSILMEGVKLHALTENLFPDDATILRSLATGNSYAARVLETDREFDTALQYYEESVRLSEATVRNGRKKDDSIMWRDLAVAQSNLGITIGEKGDRATSPMESTSAWSLALPIELSAVKSWQAAKRAGMSEANMGLFHAFEIAAVTAIKLQKSEEALTMSFEKYRSLSPLESKQADLLKGASAHTASSVAAVFHDAQRAKGNNTKPTKCDDEAGHPNDPLRAGPGRYFDGLDADRALEACDHALSKDKSNPRLIFQRGRALFKKGDKDASMAAFEDAARMGYPISFNNIAFLKDAGGLKAQASDLYVEFFNRTMHCCGRDAAKYLLERKAEAGRQALNQIAIDLLDWSAELGDPAAHEDVARILANEQTAGLKREWGAMSPSDRKMLRVRYLLIARKLYLEKKRNSDAKRLTAEINAAVAGMPPPQVTDLRTQAAAWTPKGWRDMPAWMTARQGGRDRSAERR
jgi:tetratricopeptide (TPR) repeat protein